MTSNYLEYYYDKYKINFRVQVFKKEPRPWFNYKADGYETYCAKYGQPNHREVLPTEIVLDVDYHSKDATKEKHKEIMTRTVEEIASNLDNLKLSYSLWQSGGSGYHFHLFFEELTNYPKYERDELKRLLLRKLGYGFLTEKEDKAHVHLPIMIQIEEEYSRKGGKKKVIKSVDSGENKIPKDIFIKFDIDKAMSAFLATKTPVSNGEPKSIKFFLSNDFVNSDGKKRALFVLASWYKGEGLSPELCYQKLYEWNNYTLRGYLAEKHIKATVNSVYKNAKLIGKRYRNELLKELGAEKFMED